MMPCHHIAVLIFLVPLACGLRMHTQPEPVSNHTQPELKIDSFLKTEDHQCNGVLDTLFAKGHPDSQKRLFNFDDAQYTSALNEMAPTYKKVLNPGDCEEIVILKGNRLHTIKGSKPLCHKAIVDNFKKLIGVLRDEFPNEDLPNVVLHLQTGDTSSCGRGRPEVVCLSSSYSQNCVHSLILPIHSNQDLLRTKQKVSEFQRIRRNAKPFQNRKPKAVWHGSRSGHNHVQEAVQDTIIRDSQKNSDNAYSGGSTQRELAVQLAQESSELLDASWSKVKMEKWADYQAQLSLDGNSYAGNTLEALLSGSIMLRHLPIASFQWFEPLLEPYKHYVPIAYDLSDVPGQINWVRSNPAIARKIPEHAVQLAEAISERKAQSCYTLQVLRRLEFLQRALIAALPEMPEGEDLKLVQENLIFETYDVNQWHAEEDAHMPLIERFID